MKKIKPITAVVIWTDKKSNYRETISSMKLREEEEEYETHHQTCLFHHHSHAFPLLTSLLYCMNPQIPGRDTNESTGLPQDRVDISLKLLNPISMSEFLDGIVHW